MNLNMVRKRLEALEAAAALRRGNGDDDGVLLSPADVAALWFERFMTSGDSPENLEKIARIDALLKSHRQACVRQRPEQMPPDIMEAAMRDALKRESNPNNHNERISVLLETIP